MSIVRLIIATLVVLLGGPSPASGADGNDAVEQAWRGDYDVPTSARVDVHGFGVASSGLELAIGAQGVSASASASGEHTCTTHATPAVATNTVDDFFQVTARGANRAGTMVPESFDLIVAGQKFAVNPNATKHMAEYATSTGASSVPMSSFAGSVEAAVQGGLQPGRNFLQVGPWELGIDTNGNVIYHAVYGPGAG